MSNNQNHGVNKGAVLARLGAIMYVLWGLVHYSAAYTQLQVAAHVPASIVRGRLDQNVFYVVCLATISIIAGLWLNWRNDRFGFWLNAVVISLGDIPFVLFVLLPGYMKFWPGVLGPALWIAGLIFTALGRAYSTPVEVETGFSRRPGVAA